MRNPVIGGSLSDSPFQHIADGPAAGVTDSLFANVELLLMPEAGDATILDKSSKSRTVTNNGPVSIVSDVNSPTGYAMDFGTESNLYYLTFSDDAGLKPGTGDFCIETVAMSTNTTSGRGSMTGAGSGGTTGSSFNFPWFYHTNLGPLGYPSAVDSGCNNGGVASTNSGVTWNPGGYHHWAFTRSGTTARIFCDGYEEASATSSDNVGSSNWTAFLLGMWSLPSTRVFAGKVAMFRLTTGAARYTSDFSPLSLFPKS